MAATLEGTIKRYIGLSTDRKPGVDPVPVGGEAGPPAGSTFLESDTGAIYRYHNGAWRHTNAETLAALEAAIGRQGSRSKSKSVLEKRFR